MAVHTVPAGWRPGRLDAFLAATLPAVPRRVLRRMIADGAVRVDGRRAAKGTVVRAGAVVTVPDTLAIAPNPALALPILLDDAWMLAVDKPGGMASHALDPREQGTVANFVRAIAPETHTLGRPGESGLVHRLDTGTSGVLLAARTGAAYAALRDAFARHAVEKRYLAVVGAPGPVAPLEVDLPLGHDRATPSRMVPAMPGRRAWPARSSVAPVSRTRRYATVRVTIRTGVTHQVRAHLAAAGHPVVGDLLYGGPAAPLGPRRHALHAELLVIPAGPWGPARSITSAVPADLAALLADASA